MSEIIIELSEKTATTLEKVFDADAPEELAKIIDINPKDFREFLQEKNIKPDKDLEEFIRELERKASEKNTKVKAVGSQRDQEQGQDRSHRMTQTEIINHLAEKTGVKKSDAKEFFSVLSDLATKEVKTSGEFIIPGFGKLVKTQRPAREARNPATGKTLKIPARTTVKFRVGKALKEAVAIKAGPGKHSPMKRVSKRGPSKKGPSKKGP